MCDMRSKSAVHHCYLRHLGRRQVSTVPAAEKHCDSPDAARRRPPSAQRWKASSAAGGPNAMGRVHGRQRLRGPGAGSAPS